MNISADFPPNIEEIRKFLAPQDDCVFTYGDTIYNPYGGTIDAFLFTHEETHMHQQKGDPGSWWDHYLSDPVFRLQEELQAYQRQYAHAKKVIKDRNALSRYRHILAHDLSSSVYGFLIPYSQASTLICQPVDNSLAIK